VKSTYKVRRPRSHVRVEGHRKKRIAKVTGATSTPQVRVVLPLNIFGKRCFWGGDVFHKSFPPQDRLRTDSADFTTGPFFLSISVFLFLVFSLFFFVWFPGYLSAFVRTLIYSILSYRVVSNTWCSIMADTSNKSSNETLMFMYSILYNAWIEVRKHVDLRKFFLFSVRENELLFFKRCRHFVLKRRRK